MAEVDHIDANVAAGFCAGMDKILILAVLKRRLLQKERNWSQFCLDNQHLHKTLLRSISLRNITPTNVHERREYCKPQRTVQWSPMVNSRRSTDLYHGVSERCQYRSSSWISDAATLADQPSTITDNTTKLEGTQQSIYLHHTTTTTHYTRSTAS